MEDYTQIDYQGLQLFLIFPEAILIEIVSYLKYNKSSLISLRFTSKLFRKIVNFFWKQYITLENLKFYLYQIQNKIAIEPINLYITSSSGVRHYQNTFDGVYNTNNNTNNQYILSTDDIPKKKLSELPSSILKLTLDITNLNDNDIKRLRSLSLKKLIIVNYNKITKKGLSYFSSNLTKLELDWCQTITFAQLNNNASKLTGLKFNKIGNIFNYEGITLFKNLTKFDINNNVYIIDKDVKGLPSTLTKLNLSGGKISNEGLKFLSTNITDLDLSSCEKLDDNGFVLFKNYKLIKLNLSDIKSITDVTLYNLPSTLTELDLTGCVNITDEGLKYLFTNLTNLYLYYGSSNKGKCNFIPSSITKLDISTSYLTNLTFLPYNLTYLDVSHCVVNNFFELNINAPKLKYLFLKGNIISNETFKFLSSTITHLDLSQCRTQKDVLDLKFLYSNLKSLELEDSYIQLKQDLTLFSNIKYLNLSKNQITDNTLLRLPSTLTELELCNCHDISDEGLLYLPSTLLTLTLSKKTNITTMGITALKTLNTRVTTSFNYHNKFYKSNKIGRLEFLTVDL
jgi:hypothetical protein